MWGTQANAEQWYGRLLPPAHAVRPHPQVAVLQDAPRPQADGPLQQTADHRAGGL